MSAKHAVLGLVIERPGYGYQLAQRLDERCGAWGWERSGVYEALDRLEREGNVLGREQKRSETTGRRAPRVIYEATPHGKDYYREWVWRPTPLSPVRQELDLKILLSGPEFLPRLIDQSWAQERHCIDELQALTSEAKASIPNGMPSWREAAAVLQRDAAIAQLQMRIKWLQDARKVMQEMLDRPGGAHPR